ncbi:hypothetical protein RRG08_062218 [Elysia crispata]|uniref:Uncharacterized protein n=1 Tax=Elysia crispata TaxID=231223 RepID=A0AAE0Y9I4_9GAST|nr:hypothetical protein RRG08_062218 [Elysia crispata]
MFINGGDRTSTRPPLFNSSPDQKVLDWTLRPSHLKATREYSGKEARAHLLRLMCLLYEPPLLRLMCLLYEAHLLRLMCLLYEPPLLRLMCLLYEPPLLQESMAARDH